MLNDKGMKILIKKTFSIKIDIKTVSEWMLERILLIFVKIQKDYYTIVYDNNENRLRLINCM